MRLSALSLALIVFTLALSANAQQPGKLQRIGVLGGPAELPR
jgi:hypothetical protein